MDKKLLIFGCGYSARFICEKLIPDGWKIFGTTRKKNDFAKLMKLKIEPVFWDDSATIANILSEGCSLLSCIAPKGSFDDGLTRLLQLIKVNATTVNWIGYMSSTGVYGDRSGGWVTEESVLDTTTTQGLARISAEKNWQILASEHQIPLFIFRIAGIYGPGRSVFDRIKAGTVQKVIKSGQYFNRIHVDDLAGAVSLSLLKPKLAGIYNISDNLPSSGADIIDEATKIIGISILPEVSFSDANLSTMARSFYMDSKRVSNKKLTESLQYSLKYSDYFSGLRAIKRTG